MCCDYRKSVLTWEDVAQQFQQSAQHFDTLDSPAVIALRNSDDAQLRRYAQIFDQSRSQAPAVMLATFSSVYACICMYMYIWSIITKTSYNNLRIG